mgnify:FL=1
MFENMTLDELLEAQKSLENQLQNQKDNVIAEIAERMKQMNITISDIQNFLNHSKPVSISKPKYRNPDNHDEVWSGRGKPPNWFKAAIESGITKDNMLIPA